MSDCMHFPDTVEEFMEQYKMTDTKQVYSNGIEYVPIFRMEQWFEHEKAQLSKEGTTKDVTSDLISRTETVEQLQGVLDVTIPITDYDDGYIDGVEVGVSTVSTMPPAQPERKKGEWLPDNNNAYEMRFVCSCCKESEVVPTIGFTKYKPLWDFCPNCGADMRGEKDG